MAFALGCEEVSLEYAAKRVLSDVTLGVDEGARIGIVGRNGDGKSSLVSILAGALEPDSGRVFKRNDLTLRIVAQDDDLDPASTVVRSIFGEAPEYVWASDPRIRSILDHLVGDVGLDTRIGELSGGERRRVYLASALVGTDDILMLDEPTNHLDMATISWLASHLNSRWHRGRGVLLMVTHDRWFLDEVCTSMWEVHDAMVEPFEGGYSAYVLQRVEREEAARVAEAKRQNQLRRELAWLSRGARARSTKPKFHVKLAESLIADEPPARDPIELKRAAIARLGKQAVELVGVTKELGGRKVIDNVSWIISPGDRIGILGANGAGKTTLLRIIDGKLEPDSGYVKIGKTVKMAVLSQRLEELDGFGDYQVREVLSRYRTRYVIDGKEITSSQLLERLGFSPAHIMMPVSKLSGGQKRRLQLMLTLLEGANVLILDEPGNDMDVDMLAQMESVLDGWPGTLIMVTHDRHLMERVTDNQFAIIDGHVMHIPGGVDQYLEMMQRGETGLSAPVSTSSDAGSVGKASATGDTVRADGQAEGVDGRADRRVLSNSERQEARRRLASAERRMTTQQGRVETAADKLAQCDPTDYASLAECEEELAEQKRRLSEIEDEWLELSELLGE